MSSTLGQHLGRRRLHVRTTRPSEEVLVTLGGPDRVGIETPRHARLTPAPLGETRLDAEAPRAAANRFVPRRARDVGNPPGGVVRPASDASGEPEALPVDRETHGVPLPMQ
jgi:hypothetical protein